MNTPFEAFVSPYSYAIYGRIGRPFTPVTVIRKTANKAIVKYREDGPEVTFTLRQGEFYEMGRDNYKADRLELNIEKATAANAAWKINHDKQEKAHALIKGIQEHLESKRTRGNSYSVSDGELTRIEAAHKALGLS